MERVFREHAVRCVGLPPRVRGQQREKLMEFSTPLP